MSGTPLGRYNPKPKMRVQKAEVSVHTTTSATNRATDTHVRRKRCNRTSSFRWLSWMTDVCFRCGTVEREEGSGFYP